MSLINSILGTNVTASKTNAAQQNIAFNTAGYQGTMAGNTAGIYSEQTTATVNFSVTRADNGFILATSDPRKYEDHRYIAATVDELKDLFVAILVQNKMDGA